MKLVVPDVVSPSYFPALAAEALGHYRREGVDIEVGLLAPVEDAYAAMRAGDVAFVAGSAHSALSAFPEWEGASLVCAQSQGLYWFLVLHADFGAAPGDFMAVAGKRIGAAPWVGKAFSGLLLEAGIDLAATGTRIVPVPAGHGTNFGLAAADALRRGEIDGFWANGMGATLAVKGGYGTIVYDARRAAGPPNGFDFTMATVAASDALIAAEPEAVAAVVRAIVAAQKDLRRDPALATEVSRAYFPDDAVDLIAERIAADAPFYDASLSPRFVAGMNAFCRRIGILDGDPAYDTVVATRFAPLWRTA
ncbi:ABC transporter substrate-binding protein [Acuticoccus mangrovi]|uniref:ABC transporter substrate-binding protein n=1 Tax=Acuticoccus mangrovi TaxID=2796142 RepID=A0A934IIJ1_9HYPH|nr:ABC transporter substrate-binding protein [Acuticoccus mangrovi]